MCQRLPTGEFKIVEDTSDAMLEKILKHGADEDIGYYLEVDVSYPDETHDYLQEFPPGPEKKAPTSQSPFQRSLLEEVAAAADRKKPSAAAAAQKLIATLDPKSKHIVHYRLLQKYVELGMKVDRVHKIIQFQQSAWMAPYIQLNSQLRGIATTDFEKDFYKLMNNR